MSDHNIPVAKAIFDTSTRARKKIEAANFAVIEALVAMVELQDPLAPAVFGASAETLQSLANMDKARLNALLMTGVPIFLLRVATCSGRMIHGHRLIRNLNACTQRTSIIDVALKTELQIVRDFPRQHKPLDTGYVIDTFWTAREALLEETFEDVVRRAIAFGNNTDTTTF